MIDSGGDFSLSALQQVRVGTLDAAKIAAVREALRPYAPRVRVDGVAVESGVPDQPVGWQEIVAGARRRALEALGADPCELAVGLEDGLADFPGADPATFNVGCAAITDGRRLSLGFSSAFAYPDSCTEQALRERAPIGALFDRLWRDRPGAARPEVPARLGNVGRLTLGVLPRTEYARHAVVCALIRFLQPDLYAPVEVRA